MDMEQWGSRIEFPNYEVSDLGRVRRISTGRILKGHFSKRRGKPRYCYHDLCEQGVVYRIALHDLVAEVFLGPKPQGYTVNHKNRDRTDNRVCNLEYLTNTENIAHANIAIRAAGDKPGRPPKNKELCQQVKNLLGTKSQRAIAKELNVSPQLVTLIKQGAINY